MSTRTKIILRIVVTLVILGLTVLGVWLIWFKPTNELEIFQNLTTLQDSNEKSFITARGEVQTRDYLKDKNNKYLVGDFSSSDSQEKIEGQVAYYRLFMFGGFSSINDSTNPYTINNEEANGRANTYATITTKSNLNKYLGFNEMYEAIDDAFDYYYSYVQLAENVDNEDVKEINGLINTLRSNYNGFASLQDNELEKLLESLTTENQPTVLNQVCSIYERLYTQYFKVVDSYANLTLGLKDFVVEYVFDGNLTFDKQTVMYDVVLKSIAEWAEASKTENTAKLASYKVFTKNASNAVVFNDNSLFIVYSADVANVLYNYNYETSGLKNSDYTARLAKVVEAYATLANNYNASLEGSQSIFKLSNKQKHDLFEVTTEIDPETSTEVPVYNELQAKYNLTYFNRVRLVLNHFFRVSNNWEVGV